MQENYDPQPFQKQKNLFGNHYCLIEKLELNFYAKELLITSLGLIVEIDGNSHLSKGDYDFYREEKLKILGFEFIRFSEGDVLNNFDEVDSKLRHTIYCLEQNLK